MHGDKHARRKINYVSLKEILKILTQEKFEKRFYCNQ